MGMGVVSGGWGLGNNSVEVSRCEVCRVPLLEDAVEPSEFSAVARRLAVVNL